jgi:NAD(P)-dependent dehydrogenase (short-subunit alcohol dehydrogenase family)
LTDTFLTGRVAIVTGGGRGLGRAMARGLARAGARVVLTAAREMAELDATVQEIARETGDGVAVPMLADVTLSEICETVVARTLDAFGRLDILVNNAGRGMRFVSEVFMTAPTRYWEVSPETWRMIVDTNVTGPFLMARSATPHLIAAGWGRIINVSVSRETMRRRGFSPYGPSKAALEAETAVWAQDLTGTGVTVNALLPGGATLTGMIPERFPAEMRAKLLDPEIIVPPLLWLASVASDGITGKRIVAAGWNPGKTALQDA